MTSWEQSLVRKDSCPGQRPRIKWGISTDYRLITDPSWLTWQWALLAEQFSFADPSLSLMLRYFCSCSRFVWHCKGRTRGVSRGLSHCVLPEPRCISCSTSRWVEGDAESRDVPANAWLPWGKIGLTIHCSQVPSPLHFFVFLFS